MKAIFETAEGAVFIREIHAVNDRIEFPLLLDAARTWRHDPDDVTTPIYTKRAYRLIDRCQHIAIYQEMVR